MDWLTAGMIIFLGVYAAGVTIGLVIWRRHVKKRRGKDGE